MFSICCFDFDFCTYLGSQNYFRSTNDRIIDKMTIADCNSGHEHKSSGDAGSFRESWEPWKSSNHMRAWPNVHRVYRCRGQLQVLRIPAKYHNTTGHYVEKKKKILENLDLVKVILS